MKHDRPVAIKVLRPDLAAALGMNDLPVPGWLERTFADVEADDRLRHTEEQAGRAIAIRCPAPGT